MPGATTSGALNRAVHLYRAAPLAARIFVHGRAFLSDLAFVERYVPRRGFVVDLGCGHGLFANVLLEASPQRRVLGIDHDARKVEVARGTIGARDGLRFEVGDITRSDLPPCDAVTLVDVLHLLSPADQRRVLRAAAAALPEGGPVVVKAQERANSPRYAFTYAQEIVSSSLRFTRGAPRRFQFPSREEALGLFREAGFVVDVVEMKGRPYTDAIYLGRKAPIIAP
ncbi:MAG TPA: class I SAM-dependent methyltransferase [Candidatus Limnocylindrales bacterium]|nr:class I SAM-dependent methyltransferase [Candidatus Limnocylindrales bacterium]